ncbi:hypothetical protein AA101099_1396 [Neoasaia chiangmaiensis NBRC 101099]|uniref:Uncharacterized protein n=1 Tax=Neoasaia chiangmaiensis TaxID=320497 RepID=A0A1U9KQG2_9PROT|nr:hypothetical protein A0U93_08750 [Neoasaia chiangmaiensis]GBR38840.1 hypothetical protein AA101099_1396 [Neoasaia chiangmaiensis NBRC 101099]GEN15687.1 hypothetical protein NCH01_21180 [Neoasaia chiangmaiensis]
MPFSDVWPAIPGAIISGRALSNVESAHLNGLIAQEVSARQTENARIQAPHVHTGQGQASGPVGIGHVSTPSEAASTAETVPQASSTPVKAPSESAEPKATEGENAAAHDPDPATQHQE